MGSSPCFHFSIDDVFESLFDAQDKGISLWDQPLFKFLAELHEAYDLNVDLYLFLEGQIEGKVRRLEELSDRFLAEFSQAPWIRLGPHALDYEHAPYQQTEPEQRETFLRTYAQIDRLGGKGSRSKWVRLHYFSEAYDSAETLRAEGVEGLFLTDKDAVSYHLPDDLKKKLEAKGEVDHLGLKLIRSHTRLETLIQTHPSPDALKAELDRFIQKYGYLVLFTHEIDLKQPEVRDLARACFDHLLDHEMISL